MGMGMGMGMAQAVHLEKPGAQGMTLVVFYLREGLSG